MTQRANKGYQRPNSVLRNKHKNTNFVKLLNFAFFLRNGDTIFHFRPSRSVILLQGSILRHWILLRLLSLKRKRVTVTMPITSPSYLQRIPIGPG